MVDYTFLQHFIFYGKVAGAVGSFAAVSTFAYTKLVSPVFAQVISTFKTVNLVATNHLPHIQASLDRQDATLAVLVKDSAETKADLKANADDLRDTKQLLGTVHGALLTHLNNTSVEKPRRKHAVR